MSKKRRSKVAMGVAAAIAVSVAVTGLVWAAEKRTRLQFTQPIELSTASSHIGSVDGQSSIEGRLMSLQYETSPGSGIYENVLISVYADAGVSTMDAWLYDGTIYKARDVFVTRSTDGGVTWSQPVCLSVDPTSGQSFASSSTIDGDPDGIFEPIVSQNFPGDCDRPEVYGDTETGPNAVITFISAYDMNGQGASQGLAVYPEFGGISRGYHSAYAIKTSDGGVTWSSPQQLGDATRDAKQFCVDGGDEGVAITWQEDPLGLRIGDGEGPGDGDSGANTSKGTDMWYTALKFSDFASMSWPDPMRITDNATKIESGVETGKGRASRPQVIIVGQEAVLAYEERKSLEKFDEGKYLRYHTFPAFNYPFVAAMTHVDSGLSYAMTGDVTLGQGWIISKPDRNSRRVRLVAQDQPGPTSGTVIAFLYKQGENTKGGAADLMLRVGRKNSADANSTGLRPEDLYPPVNFSSTGSYPLPTGLDTGSDRELAFGNAPAINISSIEGLDAESEDDFLESSRGAEGVLDGDRLVVGFTWTHNWYLTLATDLANENAYIRRSFDGGITWDERRNITNVTDTTLNVHGCSIIPCAITPDPGETTNPDIFYVAFNTEVNQYDALYVRKINRDVFMMRTTDYGETYEQIVNVSDTGNIDDEDSESHVVVNAAGDRAYVAWQRENYTTGEVFNTMISSSSIETYTVDSKSSDDDDDSGCSTGRNGGNGWLLVALLAGAALATRRMMRVRA